MKICSTLLEIIAMHIKTTEIFYIINLAKKNLYLMIRGIGMDMKEREQDNSSTLLVDCRLAQPFWKTIWHFLLTLKKLMIKETEILLLRLPSPGDVLKGCL